jgi:hypothetical protein
MSDTTKPEEEEGVPTPEYTDPTPDSDEVADAAPVTASDDGAAPVTAPVTSGGKSLKKGGKKSGKKSRKMNAGARDWVNLVMDVFKKNRAKNPSYKYKQAMKDAAKLKKKNNKTKKA